MLYAYMVGDPAFSDTCILSMQAGFGRLNGNISFIHNCSYLQTFLFCETTCSGYLHNSLTHEQAPKLGQFLQRNIHHMHVNANTTLCSSYMYM